MSLKFPICATAYITWDMGGEGQYIHMDESVDARMQLQWLSPWLFYSLDLKKWSYPKIFHLQSRDNNSMHSKDYYEN